MTNDDLQLGPTQKEIYEILRESGEELFVSQIADRGDRLSNRSVSRALEPLCERGLVNQRDSGDPRGWYLYSADSGDGA